MRIGWSTNSANKNLGKIWFFNEIFLKKGSDFEGIGIDNYGNAMFGGIKRKFKEEIED